MSAQVSHGVAHCRTSVSGWGHRRLEGEVAHSVAKRRTNPAIWTETADFCGSWAAFLPAVALECDGSATVWGSTGRPIGRVPHPFRSQGIKIPAWQVPRRVMGGGVRGKRRRRVYPSPPAPSTSLGFGDQIHMSQVKR